MDYPQIVFIESTNLCNAHCVMCPNENLKRERKIIDDELFKKIINDCKAIPHHFILNLHKEGEPLIDRSLANKISYAHEILGNNVCVGLSTNASLLNENFSRSILQSGINQIVFSIDGATKEYYERIRVGLSFESVVNNVITFLRLRDEISAETSCIVQMIVGDTEEDISESKKFVDFWKNFRCKIYLKKRHSYLDGGHSILTKSLEKQQLRCCDDPFKMIIFSCDGNATLCCWDYNNEYIIGNIKNSSLVELYNCDRANYMRNKQKYLDCYDLQPCNRCPRVFGNDYISGYESVIDFER